MCHINLRLLHKLDDVTFSSQHIFDKMLFQVEFINESFKRVGLRDNVKISKSLLTFDIKSWRDILIL